MGGKKVAEKRSQGHYNECLSSSADLKVSLPFPPSVNQAWRAIPRGGKAVNILSQRGRAFRAEVKRQLGFRPAPLRGPLAVFVDLFPPDRRRRDVDNYAKALLDALTHAGIYEDDSQIEHLTLNRCPRIEGGRVDVYIWRVN